MNTIDRIKHSIRDYYVLYADISDLLGKAQKLLRPLPEGCVIVKLTHENKKNYKSQWNVNQILQVKGEAWAVINDNNEMIAYHYGAYRDNNSMFFRVKNCDFEHVELMVDERYRRKGIGLFLLYHTVNNFNTSSVKYNRVGTVIRPDNIPSIKLHKLIGFNIERKVIFFHKAISKDGHFTYINFPHYSI